MIENKTIAIINFKRIHLLTKILDRILFLNKNNNYKVILIHQDGSARTKIKLKKKYQSKIKIFYTYYPKNWSPFKKIALNYIKASRYCFETLKSELCHFIEDDIFLADDYFNFSEFILKKFKNDNSFFGCNAFSKEPYNEKKTHLYSKFFYGIGKGWSINKNRYFTIKKLWNNKFINSSDNAIDGPIETFIKQNGCFVVMPICSRCIELPTNGLNTSILSHKKYFSDMKKSFVKKNITIDDYKYTFFSQYKWRKDCIKYKGKYFHLFCNFIKKIYRLFKF